jgi:hypothetical protein
MSQFDYMEHESGEWELKVLSVNLNDPPVTYTVKFYGAMNGHTIDLSFELPTTIVRRTVENWARTEINAQYWEFPRTHPIVNFAIRNSRVDVHNPSRCLQCHQLQSPGGTRFSLNHSVDRLWLTVPRNFDFHDIERNEDFMRCVLKENW